MQQQTYTTNANKHSVLCTYLLLLVVFAFVTNISIYQGSHIPQTWWAIGCPGTSINVLAMQFEDETDPLQSSSNSKLYFLQEKKKKKPLFYFLLLYATQPSQCELLSYDSSSFQASIKSIFLQHCVSLPSPPSQRVSFHL